jgi:hypothetical protein
MAVSSQRPMFNAADRELWFQSVVQRDIDAAVMAGSCLGSDRSDQVPGESVAADRGADVMNH